MQKAHEKLRGRPTGAGDKRVSALGLIRDRFIALGRVPRPPGRGYPLNGRYSELFNQRRFGSFLTAGALQFAAPAMISVVLFYSVTVAYPTVGLRTTFGALALALLGLSSTVPTLVAAFFSGALADRNDRAHLMRVVNLVGLLGTALLVGVLVLAPTAHVGLPGPSGFYLPEWVLFVYPAWAAVIVSSTLFRPAFNTSVPRVVPRSLLSRANGLIYAAAGVVTAAGVLACGILLTVEPAAYALAPPFALLFITQVALAAFDVDLTPGIRPGPPRSFAQDVRAGFAYIAGRRAILQITISGLVINFLTALATVELALYVTTWLGATQGFWYGAIVATMTIGASVGFLLIARVAFERRAGMTMILLTAALGVTLVALALVRSVWLAIPIAFLFGVIPGMFSTVFLSTIQSSVPDEVMGRVFSADEVGSYALVPVGQSVGGSLTYDIGVQGTYLAAGGTLVLFGVIMLVGFGALRRLSIRTSPGPARGSDG
ncbi:MAG TPA: MFS transporter [Thermoplasmata archaeon]|nr:MFS transporter [Thermoplasmata archaeon]